jgi:hypothetical protein
MQNDLVGSVIAGTASNLLEVEQHLEPPFSGSETLVYPPPEPSPYANADDRERRKCKGKYEVGGVRLLRKRTGSDYGS